MRKLAVALLLLLCSVSGQGADKHNQADYTLKVHISATRLREISEGNIGHFQLFAEVTLSGMKLELAGNPISIEKKESLIRPGDYQARITKDAHNQSGTAFAQNYEILLPDGTVWECYSSGVSE